MTHSKSPNYRTTVLAVAVFIAALAAGALRYRGPQPLGINASENVPSAARMRLTLQELLGDPPQTHSVGTPTGDAFLDALESRIESFGVTTGRIVIALDRKLHGQHRKNSAGLLRQGTLLKNLIATVPGRNPDSRPILIATHHDSCRWGPGAGDAGVPVAALVENLRILAKNPPNRTTQFLFTDAEEYGLLGAYALAEQENMPFERPAFVLNFDARGTFGGIPMFETHQGNAVWVDQLINNVASPKITSSLAVTVYRTLPNATDFNVWQGKLGFQGFNFATIGGAHHYHQPTDVPANVSDRTFQHMGDHLFQMHRALDTLTEEQMDSLITASENRHAGNAVFFDVLGYRVIHYSESSQFILAVIAMVLCGGLVWKCHRAVIGRNLFQTFKRDVLAVVVAIAFGIAVQSVLYTTPWANLRYTPVDYAAGVITVIGGFICATLVLVHQSNKVATHECLAISDSHYLCVSIAGLLLAFIIPGGAYLLVLPCLLYAMIRVVIRSHTLPAWAGWILLALIVGPISVLLVQALGPWKQPLYGFLSGIWSLFAMQVWLQTIVTHQTSQ